MPHYCTSQGLAHVQQRTPRLPVEHSLSRERLLCRLRPGLSFRPCHHFLPSHARAAPFLYLLFFRFPPGFAVPPAIISLERQTRWVRSTNTRAAGIIQEGQTCIAFSVGGAHRRSCAVGLFRDGLRVVQGKSLYNTERSLTYGRDLLRLL